MDGSFISHIPDKGAQTIRYLVLYSNATRERLKKEDYQPEYYIVKVDSAVEET
jgi:hypothetical protein